MATDEELIGRVAHGDETALAVLLERYERSLSHFLYRQTGGREVEDLYQETWLRVVRHASRFDQNKRFSTWLFQIAVNLCRDWYRRARAPAIEAESPTFADMTKEEERLDALALLGRLPEAQREVVVLRYFQDLSEEEVAQIVGCPPGTVKSRLHHAVQRLAQLVRQEQP
jgi:RNA polymerase sigma-70 factor (ECF subfamily)